MILNLVLPVFAYLCGSIASAVIVCRILGHDDPRKSGSQNPGATNVLRLYGKQAAALTLAGDVLKGVIPVAIANLLGLELSMIAVTGLAAFLGHLYPVFFGFKGGKGVATYIGVLIGSHWLLALGFIGIWLIVAGIFRYSSLAALTASFCIPLISYWLFDSISVSMIHTAMTALLFWRHRLNIHKLVNGEESRIGSKKT